MNIRKNFIWKCREKEILLGEKTHIMGILNMTPDSFSDGGNNDTEQKALSNAMNMIDAGADIIDIGGESSRPGSLPISEKEELLRVMPIIKSIRKNDPNILISIDTTKAVVAEAAINEGADIVNDISAMTFDPKMKSILAKYKTGVILMHMQGSPKTMQKNPQYENIIKEVYDYLDKRANVAIETGVNLSSVVLDPGIGFGKSTENNITLLKGLNKFSKKYPLLVGLSRKNFIGDITKQKIPSRRLGGSLASAAYAITQGAHILRVHDVLETCDLCRVLDKVLFGEDSNVAK